MDPDNPVIRLCVRGVEAETAARLEEARALFAQAWRASSNDVEACIAAHYVARLQDTPELALWWSQVALARADVARDPRVRGFYPSLHLNLGMAHETLGQLAAARHHYERAREAVDAIEDADHRVVVVETLTRTFERLAHGSGPLPVMAAG
jgi:hypothetical protein